MRVLIRSILDNYIPFIKKIIPRKIISLLRPYLESMPMSPLGSRYHNNIARDYELERATTKFWKKEQSVFKNEIVPFFKDQNSVLDCPVGTGRFFREYSESNLYVVGVDLSSSMLALAEDQSKNFSSDIDLYNCDASSVNKLNIQPDIIVSVRFLQNIVDIHSAKNIVSGFLSLNPNYLILELGYRHSGIFRWCYPSDKHCMRKLLYKDELIHFLQNLGLSVVYESSPLQLDNIGVQKFFVCEPLN